VTRCPSDLGLAWIVAAPLIDVQVSNKLAPRLLPVLNRVEDGSLQPLEKTEDVADTVAATGLDGLVLAKEESA
jgi:hypothetical protein